MAYELTQAGLKEAVKDILFRPNFPENMLESSINGAQERIERVLRIPLMEKTLRGVCAASGDSLDVPADFIEAKNIFVNSIPLERVSPEQLSQAPMGGATSCFARKGDEFVFRPSLKAGDTYEVWYYAKQPTMSDTVPSNVWVTDCWEVMLFGTLTLAGELIAEDRVTQWETRYMQGINEVKQEGYDYDYHGSTLHVPSPMADY